MNRFNIDQVSLYESNNWTKNFDEKMLSEEKSSIKRLGGRQMAKRVKTAPVDRSMYLARDLINLKSLLPCFFSSPEDDESCSILFTSSNKDDNLVENDLTCSDDLPILVSRSKFNNERLKEPIPFNLVPKPTERTLGRTARRELANLFIFLLLSS